MITTKLFSGKDDIQEALEVRKAVFINEQGISERIERDEYDKVAEHVIVYENGIPLATGRLLREDNQYTIGRVAVLKEHRSKKLGAVVVNALVEKAFKNGASEVQIHAQKWVQGFYEKLGFRVYGDVFVEAGIEHISMSIMNNTVA